MPKRRWGDRRDGELLRKLPVMSKIMPMLMPNRADNEAYVNVDIDLRPLDAYLAKKNEGLTEGKYTYFHLITAAAAKAFVLRPKMNRFICNNRLYQRNQITVAFMVKKKFDDRAEEGLAYLEFDPKDNIDAFHEKIMNLIYQTRREDVRDPSTSVMDAVSWLPHFLVSWIVKLVRYLDRFGLAPEGITGADPNHASIFLSNLGSIGLQCGYHHLVNWGTNSCFVVVGKKHWTVDYDENGPGECHQIIPLGITLDERIADGYYYAGTMALIKELLEHPELLDLPADSPVEYSIRR